MAYGSTGPVGTKALGDRMTYEEFLYQAEILGIFEGGKRPLLDLVNNYCDEEEIVGAEAVEIAMAATVSHVKGLLVTFLPMLCSDCEANIPDYYRTIDIEELNKLL